MNKIGLGFNKKVTLTIKASSENKNVVFTDPPVWSVVPEGIVSLAPAVDGLTCVATNTSTGIAMISVSGKASFKSGSKTLQEEIQIECLAAAPDSLGVIVGIEEDI